MASSETAPARPALGLTLDCADPRAQARFWSLALGYEEAAPPDGWATWESFLTDQQVPEVEWNDGAAIADPDGVLPSISMLRVPEPKQVKNRLHLDVQVSGGRHIDPTQRTYRIDTKVDELLAAGATMYERYHTGGHLDHVTMLDPEGNEFCVV